LYEHVVQLQAWNDFISSSEEQQTALLNNDMSPISEEQEEERCHDNQDGDSPMTAATAAKVDLDGSWVEVGDKRSSECLTT